MAISFKDFLYEQNTWVSGEKHDIKNFRLGDNLVGSDGKKAKNYIALNHGFATIDGLENYNQVKIKVAVESGQKEIIIGLDALEAIVKAFGKKEEAKEGPSSKNKVTSFGDDGKPEKKPKEDKKPKPSEK